MAEKRLRVLVCLNRVKDEDLSETLARCFYDCDAVKEDSPADRVSHFALRICAAARLPNRRSSFREFFINSERLLFRRRIEIMAAAVAAPGLSHPHPFLAVLKNLRRHLRRFLELSVRSEFVHLHDCVSDMLDSGYFSTNTSVVEKDFVVAEVPFYLVPSLVRTRRVEIVAGRARITSGDPVLECMEDLFDFLLRDSISNHATTAPGKTSTTDNITEVLCDIVLNRFDRSLSQVSSCGEKILASEVDNLSRSRLFPPCFSALQARLKVEARLQHSARIAYTLFLKEIGLPHEEAISFWTHHYSRRPTSGSACCHEWQTDRRRFEYSIGHLYGLRGARTDYSAHSCATIRSRCATSPMEQLACPFVKSSPPDIEDAVKNHCPSRKSRQRMNALVETGDCQSACACLLSGDDPDDVAFAKPSAFYFLARARLVQS